MCFASFTACLLHTHLQLNCYILLLLAMLCLHVVFRAENIRVKRQEWGSNRLEAHLGDVMRHLGEAFARAGAAAGGGGGASRVQPLQLPKLTPAGIDLLQVRWLRLCLKVSGVMDVM
jgi:hypothetical protein